MDVDRWLERLASAAEPSESERAPARLKARIYTALVNRLSETGPLLSLTATKARLCIFEEAVAALPAGERIGTLNLCRVCHARVLAERLEHAPIFWPRCPYAAFHRGSVE